MTSSLRNDPRRLLAMAENADDMVRRAEESLDAAPDTRAYAFSSIIMDYRLQAELFRELAEEAL